MNFLRELIGDLVVTLPDAIGCGEVWVKFAQPTLDGEITGPPSVWIAWRWRDMHFDYLIDEREVGRMRQPEDVTRMVADRVRRLIQQQHEQRKHP